MSAMDTFSCDEDQPFDMHHAPVSDWKKSLQNKKQLVGSSEQSDGAPMTTETISFTRVV